MKTTILALAASSSLIALAGPALAQDATPSVDSDEIVVTATRRAERLQDVPLAVSAISGEQLAESGFQDLTDIQYQFSGVQFGTSPNDAGFRLRGVGTAGGFSSASEQNVGTVVDNVVVPFGNPVNSLGDLERVEVLKGPQGTQFGKNASSGVINITTLRPKFGTVSGKAFLSYGELDEWNANASVNLPLGSKAAIGVFGFYRSNDGFLKNVVRNEVWGGEKNYGGRAKLLWEPSDGLSFYLIGDWSKTTRTGPGQLWTINALPSFANPLMAARFGSLAALGITPGFNNQKSAEEYPGYGSEQNYGLSLEINKELGDFNLTSITAWRRLDSGPQRYAIDASPVPIFTAQETGVDQSFLSQELRLTSPNGSAFEFTAGVYASRRKVSDGNDFTSAQLRPAAPFSNFIVSITNGLSNTQTRSDSLAGFIDGRYRLTQQFSLIGGFRYQYDWVDASSYSAIDPAFPPFFGPPTNGLVVPYSGRLLESGQVQKGGWSGKAGAEYKLTPDIMVFGTIARGYLGPTVTFSGLTGTKSPVKPQTVRDITLGIKSQLFDRAVTLNANVFFDKYKNLQTSVFNGTEFRTENAGGFNANGFEVDAAWRVIPELSLSGSFTYSDTEFTDYVTACPNVVKAGYACFVQNGTSLIQAAGEPLSGAPKYSATFGADLRLPITERLQFDLSTNVYYRSRVQYDVANALSFQKGYTTVGLNAGIGHPDGNWRLGIFARNLFDKYFVSSVIGLPFSDPGGEVNWLVREGRRTIGASIQAKF